MKKKETEGFRLSSREYGRLMHSINSVYFGRYEGKQFGQIVLPEKDMYVMYFFSIRAFNEYDILDKTIENEGEE